MRAALQAQLARQPLPDQRECARRSQACESHEVFRPAGLRRAIIMPPFMPRSSSSWIAVVVLGAIDARGARRRAALPVTEPAAAATQPPPRRHGRRDARSPAASDDIDVITDQATLGAQRRQHAAAATSRCARASGRSAPTRSQYDRNGGTVTSEGHIDYTDPLVHVTGAGGSYSAAAGADFRQAQFELRQRAARGSAQELKLTPQGVLGLKGVTFTTCPVNDESLGAQGAGASRSTRATRSAPGATRRSTSWACRSCTCRGCRFRSATSARAASCSRASATPPRRGAARGAVLLEHRAERGLHLRADRSTASAASTWAATCATSPQSQRGELDWNYLPDDSVFGDSRSRVRFTDVAELPDDFRLTCTPRTSATPATSRTSRRARRAPAPPSSSGAPRSPIATSTGVLDAEAQQYQTIDVNLLPGDPTGPTRACRASCWTPTTARARRGAALRLRLGGGELPAFRGAGARHQRLARGPHAAAGARPHRAGLLRAPGARLARHAVRARQPRTRAAAALALAHPADREPRHRPGVRAGERLATTSASSRSSRACCTCTCPTATRTSCRCSTPRCRTSTRSSCSAPTATSARTASAMPTR